MKYIQSGNKVTIYEVGDLVLEETLGCGQCFRWEKSGDVFGGIAFDKYITAQIKNGNLILGNTNISDVESIWIKYFDLDLNYEHVKEKIKYVHPIMEKALNSYKGIKILHQEPWETLCSFIISQNNNIPRIKGIIKRLCEIFGDKVAGGYSFPSAEKISVLSENDLAPLRCGFRASYIIDAAQNISDGRINFENIKKCNIDDARKILQKIRGVGPKVAECTLLYGFHRLEAFPLDIWMKRVMKTYFPDKSPEVFGEYAGVAQQYLFHYSRMNPENVVGK